MDFHRFLVYCLVLFLTINQCNVGAQNPVAPVDPAAATTVAVPSVPPVDPSVTQTTTTASVVSSDTPTVPASTPITTTLGSQVPSVSPGPMPPATVDQSGTTVASVPLQTSTPVTTTIPATSPMNLSSILPITLTTNLPQPVVSIAPGIVPSTPPHPVTPPQTAEERLTALENNIPKTADGIEIKGKNLIIKTGSRLFAYKGGRPNMTAEIEQIAKVLADSNQRKTQVLKDAENRIYQPRKAAIDKAIERAKALNPKPLPAGAPLNYQQINAVYKFSEVIVEGDISVTLKDAKTRVPPPPPVVATLAQIVSTRVNMTASSPPPPTTPPAPRARRQALYDTNYPSDIWTNGVYYSFDSKLSANARRVIQQAMSFWQANTCVRFIQTNPNGSTSYPVIVFISGEGCYSPVGRKTDVQIQYVSIGPQCETVTTAAHEIAHSLGMFHEQNRFERDGAVWIDTNNLEDEHAGDYQLLSSATNYNYGKPYEYRGIMHFDPNAFAKDPKKPVIYSLQADYQMSIGGSYLPVFGDIVEMNMLYSCYDICDKPNITLVCQYGGIPNPKNCNQCQCPTGFGGRDCSQRQAPTAGLKCGAVLTATPAWQNLTANGNVTAGHRSVVDPTAPAHCTWHVTAPKGSKIEYVVRYVGTGGDGEALCYEQCYNGGLNIKGMETSWRSEGMRFCCPSQNNMPMTTTANRLVIQPWNLVGSTDFQLQYKIAGSQETQQHTP